MEILLLVFSSILSLTFFLRYSSYANGSDTAFSLKTRCGAEELLVHVKEAFSDRNEHTDRVT